MSYKASESKLLIEYDIVRKNAGIFDLSNMGIFKISGSNSESFLNILCGADISYQNEGKIVNTVFCNEQGEIVFIGWILKEEDSFMLHVDFEKRSIAKKWLSQQKEAETITDLEIDDLSEEKSCLCLVGPFAQKIVIELFGEDIIGLPYLGFELNSQALSQVCLVCRYGYTGEYEYRLFFDKNRLIDFKNLITSVGSEYSLGEPDRQVLNLLMLEMKSINQNIDISPTMTPLQAGLHWMLNFRKDRFIGKEALDLQKQSENYPKLLMLISSDDTALESGSKISLDSTTQIGTIVHSGYSPTVNKSIALGLIDSEYAWPGLSVDVQSKDRGIHIFNTVSSPIFITQSVQSARD